MKKNKNDQVQEAKSTYGSSNVHAQVLVSFKNLTLHRILLALIFLVHILNFFSNFVILSFMQDYGVPIGEARAHRNHCC